MSADDDEQLRAEFNGEPGTFLDGIFAATWSHERLAVLLRLMTRYCIAHAQTETVPRWVAAGFWFLDTWIRDKTALHPFAALPKPYLDAALEKLTLLADWFFHADCPFNSHEAFLNELDQLDQLWAS